MTRLSEKAVTSEPISSSNPVTNPNLANLGIRHFFPDRPRPSFDEIEKGGNITIFFSLYGVIRFWAHFNTPMVPLSRLRELLERELHMPQDRMKLYRLTSGVESNPHGVTTLKNLKLEPHDALLLHVPLLSGNACSSVALSDGMVVEVRYG